MDMLGFDNKRDSYIPLVTPVFYYFTIIVSVQNTKLQYKLYKVITSEILNLKKKIVNKSQHLVLYVFQKVRGNIDLQINHTKVKQKHTCTSLVNSLTLNFLILQLYTN